MAKIVFGMNQSLDTATSTIRSFRQVPRSSVTSLSKRAARES
jgi:hypothetical protein